MCEQCTKEFNRVTDPHFRCSKDNCDIYVCEGCNTCPDGHTLTVANQTFQSPAVCLKKCKNAKLQQNEQGQDYLQSFHGYCVICDGPVCPHCFHFKYSRKGAK